MCKATNQDTRSRQSTVGMCVNRPWPEVRSEVRESTRHAATRNTLQVETCTAPWRPDLYILSYEF